MFLHRSGSNRPFLATATQALEGALREAQEGGPSGAVLQRGAAMVAALVAAQASTPADGASPSPYMEVPFASVGDYMHLLRAACRAMAPAGHDGVVLLAAAVSDFYVPFPELGEHKIQSGFGAGVPGGGGGGGGALQLTLQPVPKALGALKRRWAPHAAVVSFKLETDPALLLPKAAAALDRYGMDGVVANLLPTRYQQVTLVTPVEEGSASVDGAPLPAPFTARGACGATLAAAASSACVATHVRRVPLQGDASGGPADEVWTAATVIRAPPAGLGAHTAASQPRELLAALAGLATDDPSGPGAAEELQRLQRLLGVRPAAGGRGDAAGPAALRGGSAGLEDLLACSIVSLHDRHVAAGAAQGAASGHAS